MLGDCILKKLRGTEASWAFWGIVGLAVFVIFGIAFNATPYLRGPDSWRWAYAIPGVPRRHLVPIAITVIYGVAMSSAFRRVTRSGGRLRATWWFLATVAISVPVIQAALMFADSPNVLRPLFYRTISPGGSGVFTVGSWIQDPLAFLKTYPARMPTFPVHPQRYPPGLVMLFYFARQVLELVPSVAESLGLAVRSYQCHNLELMQLSNTTLATAFLQMALPAVSGLVVFPLYGLAREIGNRRVALLAVALYPLVPSFALWSARWDQFYPVLACTIWYMFYVGLNHNRRCLLGAAGLLLSLSTMLSFGLASLLMPLGVTGLFWALHQPERRRWSRLALDVCMFAAGLALPWVLYQLVVGNGFIDIWRISMFYHLGLARGYWVWLGYHLYDFLLFLGLPIAGLFIVSLSRSIKRFRVSDGAFVLVVGLSLLLLDISGVARGEVARVWLFLTPFPVIAAACVLDTWPLRHRAAMFVLLALQLLVFNMFLRVVTTGITDPPARVQSFDNPDAGHALSADFDGQAELLGYDLSSSVLRQGGTLGLTLYWRSPGRISYSYSVFNHLRSPSGVLISQQDGLPMQGVVPTTCWAPDEVIADRYVLAIPTEAEPGVYDLVTGLYRWETGERLHVFGVSALPERAVLIARIEVREADVFPDL